MAFNRCLRAMRALGITLALGTSLLAGAVHAQSSTSPMRILVGFPAGGGTDAIARLLAEKLKDQLGQPVLVDNKAGAGGQIAAQALKARMEIPGVWNTGWTLAMGLKKNPSTAMEFPHEHS